MRLKVQWSGHTAYKEGNQMTFIKPEDRSAFENTYVLHCPRTGANDVSFFQYHAGYWDGANDESKEQAYWSDFLHCAITIMEALGDDSSVITLLEVAGPHKASAKLEAWYDKPPLSGRTLSSNYGMDLLVLTCGVPVRELNEFFESVTLGMNEINSVRVFRQPFAELSVQQEKDLLDLWNTGAPMLRMELTHHPMLHITYDATQIAQEQIVLTAEMVMKRLHKKLEVRA